MFANEINIKLSVLKKGLLPLSLFYLFSLNMKAQKADCTGEMLNINKMETDNICFLREVFPNYRTKYIIRHNSIEIYEINFTYSAIKDSSLYQIFFIDKSTYKSEIKELKFETASSFHIIKNYSPNDTNINFYELSNTILFSVPDIDDPYVILNMFLTPDNKILFRLTPLDNLILSKHSKRTGNYITMKYRDSINKANRLLMAQKLQTDLIKHSDSLINNVRRQDSSRIFGKLDKPAETPWQNEFSLKIANILNSYFKNAFKFSSEEFDIDFTLSCKGDGRIRMDEKSIYFKKGGQENWVKNAILTELKPNIESMELKTHRDSVFSQYLLSDFLRFINNDTIQNFRNELSHIIGNIENELKSKLKREIPVPTQYTYNFKLQIETKKYSVKYTPSNDEGGRFINQTSGMDRKDMKFLDGLEKQFHDKIYSKNKKEKKFDIEICTIIINGEVAGKDIRDAKTNITKQKK